VFKLAGNRGDAAAGAVFLALMQDIVLARASGEWLVPCGCEAAGRAFTRAVFSSTAFRTLEIGGDNGCQAVLPNMVGGTATADGGFPTAVAGGCVEPRFKVLKDMFEASRVRSSTVTVRAMAGALA